MILTTLNNVPSKQIKASLGLVRGNTIRAKNIGKDIIAGFRNIVGGEIKEYTEALNEAREEAMESTINRLINGSTWSKTDKTSIKKKIISSVFQNGLANFSIFEN